MKDDQSLHIFTIALLVWLLAACGGQQEEKRQPVAAQERIFDIEEPASVIPVLDTNRNIDSMSIQELRILRSLVYARHGMLFDEGDLRRYWKGNTVWYDTLSRSRYEKAVLNDFVGTIVLPGNEQDFVSRIDDRMIQLRRTNYLLTEFDTTANILNIVNMFQYPEITNQETMAELAVHNDAIVADTLPQLFQIYQRNDSLGLPNFVTIDLMVQLSHVYEVYVLRMVEENHFAPMLTDLCLSLYQASMSQYGKAVKEDVKDIAAYNAAFYAIPYNLLTGKQLKMPDEYQTQVEEELAYVAQQEDHRPVLLDVKNEFPYSAFKPYGHYTHTAELRRYYKAMRWLQLAPYCSNEKVQLQRAVFAAIILSSAKTKSGEAAIDLYKRWYEAMIWFVGQPVYGSLYDIAVLLSNERVTSIDAIMDSKMLDKTNVMLGKKQPGDESATKYASGCTDGIYFMPQPYDFDKEIFYTLTDKNKDAERTFPKVLDVFAAFGSQPAVVKLLSDNREDTIWAAYPEKLAGLKNKMSRFKDWNRSSYDKRMECLLAMQQKPQHSPLFMQKKSWNTKVLKTASASWVKLKHDMSLYGKIPEYPEPADTTAVPVDNLPEPVVPGYVEPNPLFWKKLLEWIELTDRTLKKYQLATDSINKRTECLYRYIAFMEESARKELNNERLTDEAYRFISHIGDSVMHLTLSMIEPRVDRWAWTAGTDRSVAVFENMFQRNIAGFPGNGSLYAATGYADNIYVMVEIGGYLYLTKGAVYNYYEFPMPERKELKENNWKDILRAIHEDSEQFK